MANALINISSRFNNQFLFIRSFSEKRLGTHRFQRADFGGMSFENQWVDRHVRTLEAMRTQASSIVSVPRAQRNFTVTPLVTRLSAISERLTSPFPIKLRGIRTFA